MNFDEMGLECNEWIPFESLKDSSYGRAISRVDILSFALLKGGFSWNSWMHWLPEEHQQKEIASRLYDPRVLKHFQRYHSESTWLLCPTLWMTKKK